MSKLSGGKIAGIVGGAIITAIVTAYAALTIKKTFINQVNIISSLYSNNNNNNFEEEKKDDDSEDDNITQVPKTFQGFPLGLRLCQYEINGDYFFEAKELYHYKVNSPSGLDKLTNLTSIIKLVNYCISTDTSQTMTTAKSIGKIPNTFGQINWNNCIISRRILVSKNAKPNGNYANLFYQGWLFDNAVKQNVVVATAYPLIGVFYPKGAIIQSLGNDYYAPTDGSFKIFNQHIHRDETLYEGRDNRDDYISYLISTNDVSKETAERMATMNKIKHENYQFGPDSSRIAINPNENFGTAFIICLDLSNFKAPKLMITFLLLVKDKSRIENIKEILTDKETINNLINLPSPMPMKGGKSNHRRTVKRCKIYS